MVDSIFKDATLTDVFIMIVCFRVVSPFVSSLPIFNKTLFGKYVAAILTLLFIPLFFNQRTPTVRHIIDTNDHILLKFFGIILLSKVVVDNPPPRSIF